MPSPFPASEQRCNHPLRYQEKFREAGWEFGNSILSIRRCPCCSEGATPDPEKEAAKTALTDMLGNDEDGLAAMMEDYGL